MRIVDIARSGLPSTVMCVEVKGKIDHRIRDTRRISTDETASEMSVSHGFIYNTTHNDPAYRGV
jgi:hypothetical protein